MVNVSGRRCQWMVDDGWWRVTQAGNCITGQVRKRRRQNFKARTSNDRRVGLQSAPPPFELRDVLRPWTPSMPQPSKLQAGCCSPGPEARHGWPLIFSASLWAVDCLDVDFAVNFTGLHWMGSQTCPWPHQMAGLPFSGLGCDGEPQMEGQPSSKSQE